MLVLIRYIKIPIPPPPPPPRGRVVDELTNLSPGDLLELDGALVNVVRGLEVTQFY